MGSSSKCEIIEVRDSHRNRGNSKPPIQRTGGNYKKTLDDDINKLFEAVNLRASKSLDLSDKARNASKKPMISTGSYSPGIGFSEPVSLKQALRGLCISQAVEMASIKRSSILASPRSSESGKIGSVYRSVVVQTEDATFICNAVVPCPLQQVSAMKSASPESHSSHFKPKNDVKTSMEAASKQRQSSRSQTVASSGKAKGKKGMNSTKTMSGTARPAVRSKSVVIKKAAKVALPTDRNSKTAIVSRKGKDHASMVCERCQCSMRDNDKDCVKDPSSTISVIKPGKALKKNENRDVSKSSKSSACDLSSSTTSISEESNLSSFHCSNKPHMSKDIRWKAIKYVIEKEGSLGLRHFSLLKKLGSGDIGTVYLAELQGTSCQFAIKVMDNEFLTRRKKMPRAQTEREILKMLDHPFLPTLYAQFTSDNLSGLVLEFCPGGDLHVLRQRQPARYFPEDAARFYVAEVLLALEYLHMLGIVYRDLKPENILVRDDGHIMLTDFDLSLICTVSPTLIKSSAKHFEPPRFSGQCTGSSCIDPFCTGPTCNVSCLAPKLLPHSARARKLRGDHSLLSRSLPQLVAEPTEARSNSFVGTHEYLAPEIIKGEGHGSAVDWWTLGVFLYELLYGKTPFKGAGNEETLTNVVLQNLRFPDFPIVSFQARDLIRSLLVKEPESRMGTQTGAGEIKRHPFFQGLNWALVRSATPPQVPESGELGVSTVQEEETYLVYGPNGEQLKFELF